MQVLLKPRPGVHGTIGGTRHPDSAQHSPRLHPADPAASASLRNLSSASLSSLGGPGALSPTDQQRRGISPVPGSMHSRSGSVLEAGSLAGGFGGMSASGSGPASRNASHTDLAMLAGGGQGGRLPPSASRGSLGGSRAGSHVDLSSLGRGGTGGIWDASPAEMESFRRHASHNVSGVAPATCISSAFPTNGGQASHRQACCRDAAALMAIMHGAKSDDCLLCMAWRLDGTVSHVGHTVTCG